MTMTLPGFVYGLVWNKYTQGSAGLFIGGYMFAQGGWPLTKWVGRGAWKFGRWAGPPVGRWSLARAAVLGSDLMIMGEAAASTQTAAAIGRGAMIGAAVGVGYTGGAVVGTGIVSLAEKEGIVYEGATEDVLDFYMGQAEGDYWGDYDWKGKPKSGPTSTFKNGKLVVEEPMPGFFNIPGNVRYIAGWYWNRPYEDKEYRF